MALDRYTCTRCAHTWLPRQEQPPKKCPNCDSPYWSKPRGQHKVNEDTQMTTITANIPARTITWGGKKKTYPARVETFTQDERGAWMMGDVAIRCFKDDPQLVAALHKLKILFNLEPTK